jgi:hypothetical protein
MGFMIALLAMSAQEVTLRWKAEAPLGFKVSLKQVGAKEVDASGLAEWAAETAKARGAPEEAKREIPGKLKEFLGSLKLPDEFNMTMIVGPAVKGRIPVKVVQNATPIPAGPSPLEKALKEMEGTVQLRGEIDPSGAILSWWLQDPQKNLLAMLSELPARPVKPGDQWSLRVNLVTMGHGFIPSLAERVNVARLAEVREGEKGERIAVLDLLLSDRLEGELGDKPITFSLSYAARAEFSVTRGAWIRVAGRMRTRATGMMNTDAAQELAIEPLSSVPEALLKLR